MHLREYIAALEQQTAITIRAQNLQKNACEEFMNLCLMVYDFKNYTEVEELSSELYSQVLQQIEQKLLQHVTNFDIAEIKRFLTNIQQLEDEQLSEIATYITRQLLYTINQKNIGQKQSITQQQERENQLRLKREQEIQLRQQQLKLSQSSPQQSNKNINRQSFQKHQNIQNSELYQLEKRGKLLNQLNVLSQLSSDIQFEMPDNLFPSAKPRKFGEMSQLFSSDNDQKMNKSLKQSESMNTSHKSYKSRLAQKKQQTNSDEDSQVLNQSQKAVFNIFDYYRIDKNATFEVNRARNNNLVINVNQQRINQYANIVNYQTDSGDVIVKNSSNVNVEDNNEQNFSKIEFFQESKKQIAQFAVASTQQTYMRDEEVNLMISQLSTVQQIAPSDQIVTFYIVTTDGLLHRGYRDILTNMYEFEQLDIEIIQSSQNNLDNIKFTDVFGAHRRRIINKHELYPSIFSPILQKQNHTIDFRGLTVTDSVFLKDSAGNIHELVITGFVCQQQQQLYLQSQNDFLIKFKKQLPKKFTMINQNLIIRQKEDVQLRQYEKQLGKSDEQYTSNKSSDQYFHGRSPFINITSGAVLIGATVPLLVISQQNKLVTLNKRVVQLLCGQPIQTCLQHISAQQQQNLKHYTPLTTFRDKDAKNQLLTSTGLSVSICGDVSKQLIPYQIKLVQDELFGEEDGIFDKVQLCDVQQLVFGYLTSTQQDYDAYKQLVIQKFGQYHDVIPNTSAQQFYKFFALEKITNCIKEIRVPVEPVDVSQTECFTILGGYGSSQQQYAKLEQIQNITFSDKYKLLFINYHDQCQQQQNRNYLHAYDVITKQQFDLIIFDRYVMQICSIQAMDNYLYLHTSDQEILCVDLAFVFDYQHSSQKKPNESQVNVHYSNLNISQISNVSAGTVNRQKYRNDQLLTLLYQNDSIETSQITKQRKEEQNKSQQNGTFGLSINDFDIE